MPAALPGAQLAYAAAVVGIGVYLLALVLTFWLPNRPRNFPTSKLSRRYRHRYFPRPHGTGLSPGRQSGGFAGASIADELTENTY